MNHHRQQTIFFFSCKALKYAIERNRSTAYVCSHPTFDIDIYTHIGLIFVIKSERSELSSPHTEASHTLGKS